MKIILMYSWYLEQCWQHEHSYYLTVTDKPHIGSADPPGSEAETCLSRNDAADSGQAQESLPAINTNISDGADYFLKFQFSP